MAGINQLLSKDLIVVPMEATDPASAIDELLEPLIQHKLITDPTVCRESIMKRERRQSTGIGKGVALPHCYCDCVDDIRIVFGISTQGIDFRSVDGLTCHIFVLIISPPDRKDKHLKLISRFNKMLDRSSLRRSLLTAMGPEDVIETFQEFESEID